MKSRLDALLRQRELLRTHTQWLEDEIANERASTAVSPPGAAPLPESAPRLAPLPDAGALAPPEPDTKVLHNEVRHGCLLYLLLAVAAVAGLIAFIYLKYEPKGDEPLEPEMPSRIPDPASSAAPRLN